MLSSMSVTPTRFCAALVFTLAVAPGLVRAAAAEAIEIRIERQGDFITVNASALMQVDARIAWEVLSDYDNLAQFIPDMKTSRIVSREGNRALVEQKGEFFFFQAEDGIRDLTVTGVQTCALPIWSPWSEASPRAGRPEGNSAARGPGRSRAARRTAALRSGHTVRPLCSRA